MLLDPHWVSLRTTYRKKYYGKGKADFAPQEVESILSWAEDNLVTINLTKTNEIVVRGKVERPLPSINIFYIKQEPSHSF